MPVIANGNGDEVSDEVLRRLFDILHVPKQDLFEGYNGWELATGYQTSNSPITSTNRPAELGFGTHR
ncbi:MAG: hypothetical protein ACLGH0_06280 [Thermoanaerobaculia bacterium]